MMVFCVCVCVCLCVVVLVDGGVLCVCVYARVRALKSALTNVFCITNLFCVTNAVCARVCMRRCTSLRR